jgi:hypothetical protein
MSFQPFVYETQNNATLTAIKASPQHDINLAGDTFFSQSREQYVRAFSNVPTTNAVKTHKKWLGNRDSSSITERRRYNAIGNGTLNASNKPINFSENKIINTTNDALTRVRAGGYITTPKIRAKTGNNLTPSWPAGPLVRTQNRAPVDIIGDPIHGQYTTMRNKGTINNFIPTITDSGFFNLYRRNQVSNNQPILYH